MPKAKAFTFPSWQLMGKFLMARIEGEDGANITQADIDTIDLTVFDGLTVSTPTLSLTVADVVFDTLQTDTRWTDTVGFNFAYQIPGAFLPEGRKEYVLEFLFTQTSGTMFPLVVNVPTKRLRGQ